MIVAGLTGSIAMGKSETAKMFASLGVPVFDADAEVHRLYQKDGSAVTAVAAAFPDSIAEGAVDRAKLSSLVLDDEAALSKLQSIVHPLVRDAEKNFIMDAASVGANLVVLDIPLLFETGRESTLDRIIVVSAPARVQRQRAMARPGMTAEKLRAILSRQVPDSTKRAKADFIVDSARGFDHALAQVKGIVIQLQTEAMTGNS